MLADLDFAERLRDSLGPIVANYMLKNTIQQKPGPETSHPPVNGST